MFQVSSPLLSMYLLGYRIISASVRMGFSGPNTSVDARVISSWALLIVSSAPSSSHSIRVASCTRAMIFIPFSTKRIMRLINFPNYNGLYRFCNRARFLHQKPSEVYFFEFFNSSSFLSHKLIIEGSSIS